MPGGDATEIRRRIVRVVDVCGELCLADLTAPGVMAATLGLPLSQLVDRDYTQTQQISQHTHGIIDMAGDPVFDGVWYSFRNNYPSHSIALFGRANNRIKWIEDIDLSAHFDWPAFAHNYKIGIEPDPGPAYPSAP